MDRGHIGPAAARRTARRTRKNPALVFSVMGLGLALAACSTGGPQASATTATPAPSQTTPAITASEPAVTITEPALPEAKPTPASAIAFVRYFCAAYNYAYATHDVEPLRSISEPTCAFCSSAVADIKKIIDTGAESSGGLIEPIDVVSPPIEIKTGTIVYATVRQEPSRLRKATGEVVDDRGWRRLRADFALRWADARWRVEGVDPDFEAGTR